MERYDSYKDSGVDWIGEIPSHWMVTKHKYHLQLQNGYPFKSELFDPEEGFPLIRIRDITSGKIETFYKGDFEEEYVVKEGDLLIGMDGDFNTRTWDGVNGLLNQRCCSVKEGRKVSRRFLHYILPNELQIINDLTYYTTVKHLSIYDVYDTETIQPPLHEQEQIVEYLDRKTTLIDSLIEKTVRKIELLKEKRTSLINEVVTKGLNPDVEMKDSGVEWIGEIPSHWGVTKHKYHLQLQNGYPFKSELFDPEEGFPLIRIRDITSGKIETFYKGDFEEEYVVKEGDLLIGMDGDFNTRTWDGVNGLLNQRCCSVKEGRKMSRRFLHYILPNELQIINDLTYYTTVKHLSIYDVYDTETIRPPLHEQEQDSRVPR